MKIFIYLIMSLFLTHAGICQLQSIDKFEHEKGEGGSVLYEKLGVKLIFENNVWVLKSLTDSTLYRPSRFCYYEVYDNKYIFATLPDSIEIDIYNTGGPELLPRDRGYIFFIDFVSKSFHKYAIKYNKKIIYTAQYQSFKELRSRYPDSVVSDLMIKKTVKEMNSKNDFFYKIMSIDLIKKSISIRSRKNKTVLRIYKCNS